MKTRIAPSPTGYLHLGHAYSVLLTQHVAKQLGLEVILRIENIDHTRCKPEFVKAIAPDLALLGCTFNTPVWHQADRFDVYQTALQTLAAKDLLYPCTCTRADLQAQEFSSGTYPGTCQNRPMADVANLKATNTPYALRLNMAKAVAYLKDQGQWPLTFHEATLGVVTATPEDHGDVVLARKEFKTSYHLSVVVDDAAQHISHIIRGADLYQMTHIHRLLQALLERPTPHYIHHGLIVEAGNQKLSKSAAASPFRQLLKEGLDVHNLMDTFTGLTTAQSLAAETGNAFIKKLPCEMAAPLTFEPFKG